MFTRLVTGFNRGYNQMLMHYDIAVGKTLQRPAATVVVIIGVFFVSLGLYPLLGVSFFPRTDPGQFVINIKAPTGTRIELTNEYIKRVEDDIRQVVAPRDLGMIVSNIGITPDFSAIYTSNSGQHTAFVQVSLKEGHRVGSYEYMDRVRRKLADDLPELSTYFQAGGLVDAVVNLGLPAPIDLQVSSSDMRVCLRYGAGPGAQDPPCERRERRPDSAGPRLSGHQSRRESRDGGAAGFVVARGGGQRDYRA